MPFSSHNSTQITTKNNLGRNFSLINKHDMYNQSKSHKRSKQTKKSSQLSYIASSLANIQKGCINQKTGQIKIDGDYGDYRMKLFRKKDKFKHYNDPSSIFSDKDFIQNIFNSFNLPVKNLNPQTTEKSLLGDEPLSPKKTIRNQRAARMGLKRKNSIKSPSLKEVEMQKSDKIKQTLNDQDSELLEKINEILAKPRDIYLNKTIQNEENEEEKNKLKKGVEQQLRQKQGHLFYRSIPQYMAEKWFKTVDNSTPDGNRVIPFVQQPPILPPPKKNFHKRTHVFKFLQQNCKLNNQKPYKSLIFN